MYNPDIFIEEITMISALLIEYNIKKYKMEYYGFDIEGEKVILSENMDCISPAINLFFHKKENKIDEMRYLSIPLKYNKEEFKEVYKRTKVILKKYRNQ